MTIKLLKKKLLKSQSWYIYFIAIVLLFIFTAIVQVWMGRILICECGYIKFWHGITLSSENSQHISDWYTFSHIIHGFFFYWLVKKFGPTLPFGLILFIGTLPEVFWEIIENSPFIIDRYRETTISYDYYGDSVLNSLSDIAAMVLGFWMAAKLPVWFIVILILLMEVIVGYLIRDNLTFNVIMLIYPFPAIKAWQMGS